MALEPHNIAATGAVMTEVVFGFFISIALLGALYALQRRSTILAALSGVAFAYGYLVNPVIALFPLLLLPLFWIESAAKQGIVLLAVSLIGVAGWSIRNHTQEVSSFDRGAQTIVYGSWPDYDLVWKYQFVDPDALRIMRQSADEADAIVVSPKAGLMMIWERIAAEPWRYLGWYALKKPYLLWDWNILIGAGGVDYLETRNSPLETSPLLRATSAAQRLMNPLVLALALLGAILGVREKLGFPIAAFFFYITLVHIVFQAEPRYSIPYKSVEILLAVRCLADVWGFWGKRKAQEFVSRTS
jgi:hypothetical protein